MFCNPSEISIAFYTIQIVTKQIYKIKNKITAVKQLYRDNSAII